MLKWLRRITLLLFATTLVAYVVFSMIDRIKTDRTIPVISVETQELSVSVKDKKDALLRGVTATDKKDGDITSKVLVESVSKFIEPGVFDVTYAVADNDNNVTKAVRRVRYTDYVQPEFYMKRALVYSVDEDVDIRGAVGARDCIDGDISDKVSIVATDFVENTAGVFTVSLQASNSMGDIIYLDITVFVEGNETMGPEIQLEKSLIYVKKGEQPVFEDYIKEVTVNGVVMENYGLLVSTNFDSQKPGTYNVHFYVSTDEGYEGHSILTAVVEE